ncbi:hypothetical protein Tco_0771121 [Tanacetum coccineum]|uniref:Transposase n=1 Tax=Tanacetum coccineum TaxID=301880 RepID=A0ABQ4ZEE3_9ASTR
MDRRKWMYNVERVTPEYVNGFSEFIKTAEDHQAKTGEARISCPCKECAHFICHDDIETIRYHLFKHGFTNNYTWWKHHGEVGRDCNDVVLESNVNNNDDNCGSSNQNINDMLHHAEHDAELDMEKLQQLFVESEKPLYAGCTNFTKLSAVLQLFVKAEYGLSDVGFNKLLELFYKMLPKNNKLPTSTYQAKKLMCPLGLEVKRIDACPKDCILYRKGYKDLHKCPVCKVSRYKDTTLIEFDEDVTKNGPAAHHTKCCEDRKHDEKIRHVADASQWKNIDNHYTKFGAQIRNIRFRLSSDGINPFGNMSSRHSTWPGPKQPGNDIDVYLESLIDDVIDLWDKGVEVYDAYKKERFKLFAMIFCTISDFPTYDNLSGYGTKGEKACLVCEKDTHSRWLTNCKKTVYMGHRRSHPESHPYRKKKKLFDGRVERRKMARLMNGHDTLFRVKDIKTVFGKKDKAPKNNKNIWKKKSIFWKLPYWERLQVRHSLDVMHIEKNVSESLIGLLLNIKGKIKYGINARKDMVEMGIRYELAPQEIVPSGYSANIKKLVSMKDLKLIGMKSHDCHVLITQMIPIAILGILPPRVRHTITKLCLFFNMIHLKVIDLKKLDEWQRDIILTLCQLEMYFPPSFLDVMVHLVSHIIEEIKALDSYSSDPFILAKQATQILYVEDPSDTRWNIVIENVVDEDDTTREEDMVRSKCVSTKQQSQQQVNPDDEGGDDLNIADDVTQDKHQSIVIMEKPRKKRGINKIKDLPVGESMRFNKLGETIGEYQHTFTSYRGNTVRKNISILKPNWHKIDVEEKELLWLDIKLSQGMIKAQPGADPLTIVYGQDHGGRTRGVSSIVGCKKGLKGYVRKKRTYKQSLDFEELSEKVKAKLLSEELSEKVQEKLFSGPVWNRVKEKMLEELVKEPIVGTSSVRLTTSIIRIDCIKETTTCSLFSPKSILTGEKILCAHASVYPIEDGLIHGKRLRKGYMRVSVLKVLNRQEDLELPMLDEDILNLGGALNAFIQWPISAIACFSVLLGSPNTPATSAAAKSKLPKIVQRPSTECSALTNVHAITQASKKRRKTVKAPIQQSEVEKEKADIRKRLHLLKEDIDLRSEAVRNGYYRWMDREDCTMPQFVDFKKEIFQDAHDFTLPINTTDIIELLAGDKLGTNILTLFSSISNDGSSVIADSVLLLLLIRWSLYLLKATSPNQNNRTGFLNPEVITADTHMDTDINVIIYLTEALKGYDFFVAPYLHNGHHVLLIICPKHGRGFILDSFKWKEKKTKEDYYLVSQVERVVGPLSWELPIVNLQEDIWECGFYVMKWVLDFVLKYQHDDFPNIQPWGETRSLKLSEMDAVVTAWFSLWRESD